MANYTCYHDWEYRDMPASEGCYLTRECVVCQQVEHRVWTRLVPIPPPLPPIILPELAKDTGQESCNARDEYSGRVCQRPMWHPDRHFAIQGDSYVTFLTKRDIEMIEQATGALDY